MSTPPVASAPATRFWAERGPRDWARVLPTYWGAGGQPHRLALIQAMRTLPSFESVRELGSCAGTNLKLIREAFPHALVQGIEVSQEAVLFAQDKFMRDGCVGILQADILTDAPYWEPGEVDVVVTCYTLAYIAPEDIRGLLGHMVRSARVGMVLVEPMLGEPGPLRAPGGLVEWRHDYVKLLEGILNADPRPIRIGSASLDKPQELCDGLVMATFVGEGA